MAKATLNSAISVEVVDKFDGELLGRVTGDDRISTSQAVERAKEGFASWSALPAHERATVLERFVDMVETRTEELAVLLTRETGKIIGEARSEIGTAGRVFRGFARESLRFFGDAVPLDRQEGLEGDLMITSHEPLGVVAAIIAFNFPVELYAHKVGAALAAGNSVVVKPSEHNPLVANRLTELLHDAGVPEETVICVNGGADVGAALSESPTVRAISFTGSSRVGQMIAQNAARNLTRTFLELSANDSTIVLEDGDVSKAVDESIAGRMLNNGQTCCATKRVILHRNVADNFVELLTERLQAISIPGSPLDEAVTIGPLISSAAAEHVEAQVQSAVSQGAKVIHGGQRDGNFYPPTIIMGDYGCGIAADEEIFGPVFSLFVVDSDDEAVALSNASSYGLTGAVFSADAYRAYRVSERLETAIVSINGGNCYRPDGSAFGGYKRSGLGREGFFSSLEEYTQVKSVVFRGIRG